MNKYVVKRLTLLYDTMKKYNIISITLWVDGIQNIIGIGSVRDWIYIFEKGTEKHPTKQLLILANMMWKKIK